MAEYTFSSLVEEVAKNKARLSQHRFQKKEKNEIPREVYLNVCKIIAEFYEPIGFKYSKSQQVMKLRKGEFTFKISFQSSRYNIADENVKVIVHANVLSSKLKKWEKESPYKMFSSNPSGYFGGGQIGNLQEQSTWLEWNVAFPKTRNGVVKDIINHINLLALPFFDKFSNLKNIRETLVTKGERYFLNRERFLLYFFIKKDLEDSLIRFLTQRELWKKYERTLQLLIQKKEIDRKDHGTYWHHIARQTMEFDLNLEKPVANNVYK